MTVGARAPGRGAVRRGQRRAVGAAKADLGAVGRRGRRAARVGDGARDRGSGTVLLLAVMAAAVTVAVLLGLLASAQLARGRAQTAADLGALAGAASVLAGGGNPCGVVGDVVRRNDGRLAGCVDEGAGVLRVRVVVHAAGGDASASARAGPSAARR